MKTPDPGSLKYVSSRLKFASGGTGLGPFRTPASNSYGRGNCTPGTPGLTMFTTSGKKRSGPLPRVDALTVQN